MQTISGKRPRPASVLRLGCELLVGTFLLRERVDEVSKRSRVHEEHLLAQPAAAELSHTGEQALPSRVRVAGLAAGHDWAAKEGWHTRSETGVTVNRGGRDGRRSSSAAGSSACAAAAAPASH